MFFDESTVVVLVVEKNFANATRTSNEKKALMTVVRHNFAFSVYLIVVDLINFTRTIKTYRDG